MAATINTNIASINAQRNLAMSGQSLNTTMQRLSSGLRVNSAKDDAAGLAIAERMNTQVKGLTVAARNANDGISLAQTAEGALGKVGDMLQRMRELAVQSSNATNSASDRTALQAEVSQLAAEIDRVAKQTNFNGQKILDGSFAGAVFQVGANSGDNVTLGALADTRSSQISVVNYAQNTVTFDVTDTPTAKIQDYSLKINAGDLKITVGNQTISLDEIKPANSSLERLGQVVTAINNKSVDTGVTAYMSRNTETGQYDITIMSDKTDHIGTPLKVSFEGFTEKTTGIGQPTDDAFKTFVSSTSPATFFTPVDLDTGALPSALGGTDIQAYAEALAAANATWLDNGGDSTALPVDATKLTALQNAVAGYAATQDTTTAGNINTALTALRSSAIAPVSTSTPLAALHSDFDGLHADLLALNQAWISNGGTQETQPFKAADLEELQAAINGYAENATVATTAVALNTAIAKLSTQSYVLSGNTTTAKNAALAATSVDDQLAALEPTTTGTITTPATPDAFAAALPKLEAFGVDLSKFDLEDYKDATQSDGWSTKPGFTAADALAHLKEQVASDKLGGLDFVSLDNATNVRGLDNIDITTQEGAWIALKKIDSAIDQINGARATLGAMQSRFETAVSNIDIQVENLSAARGRIVDADFAVETANLSRTQILQQAGTAMVAQANQIPQNVLSLLQG